MHLKENHAQILKAVSKLQEQHDDQIADLNLDDRLEYQKEFIEISDRFNTTLEQEEEQLPELKDTKPITSITDAYTGIVHQNPDIETS